MKTKSATSVAPAAPGLSLEDGRKRIEQEDHLINHRLSWLIGSQSFLMLCFVMLRNTPGFVPGGDAAVTLTRSYLEQSSLLIYVILAAGVLISLCSAMGVFAALMAVRRWRTKVGPAERELLTSDAKLAHLGGLAAVLPGPVFATIWIMLFVSEWPLIILHVKRVQLVAPLAVAAVTFLWWLLHTVVTHRAQPPIGTVGYDA